MLQNRNGTACSPYLGSVIRNCGRTMNLSKPTNTQVGKSEIRMDRPRTASTRSNRRGRMIIQVQFAPEPRGIRCVRFSGTHKETRSEAGEAYRQPQIGAGDAWAARHGKTAPDACMREGTAGTVDAR